MKKHKKKQVENLPMKYWLVEFTLTSGETLEFYLSAINQHEAYEKADGYKFFVENTQLRNKLEQFQLLP